MPKNNKRMTKIPRKNDKTYKNYKKIIRESTNSKKIKRIRKLQKKYKTKVKPKKEHVYVSTWCWKIPNISGQNRISREFKNNQFV